MIIRTKRFWFNFQFSLGLFKHYNLNNQFLINKDTRCKTSKEGDRGAGSSLYVEQLFFLGLLSS